jgi:hypothetical protein
VAESGIVEHHFVGPEYTLPEKRTGGTGHGCSRDRRVLYCAAYSPGTLRVRHHSRPQSPNIHNKVTVEDCNGNLAAIYDVTNPPIPSTIGFVQFSASGNGGYNPCAQVIPVESTTWSRIKSEF